MNTRFPLATLLTCAILLSGCSLLSDDLDKANEVIAFETLKESYVVNHDSLTTFVLRSDAERKAFLEAYPEGSLPSIDFSQRIVVGVVAGTRSNNSYNITIDSIKATTRVVVYATEIGSAAGARIITHPAHIVTLEHSDVERREITFAHLQRICGLSPCHWQSQ